MPYSVLVIDDEALTLRTISRGLSAEGFEVFTAESGEAGLKVFNDEKPDLILLDIVLPHMDGVEVLRQVKSTSPASELTARSITVSVIEVACRLTISRPCTRLG